MLLGIAAAALYTEPKLALKKKDESGVLQGRNQQQSEKHPRKSRSR